MHVKSARAGMVLEAIDTRSPDWDNNLVALAGILHACVHAGASIGFVLPFSMDDALAFWTGKVAPAVEAGTRRLLVARDPEGRIVGTVQLNLATPPNQAHRGDVLKLLVPPDARRQGIGRQLMLALEKVALSEGRTLLTLDTRTGDDAEPLYESMGYVRFGKIPAYARHPHAAQLETCSFFYKQLGAD